MNAKPIKTEIIGMKESFGPCVHCGYEPTRAFCGDPANKLPPVCKFCLQLINAADGMLRMPEFPVI